MRFTVHIFLYLLMLSSCSEEERMLLPSETTTTISSDYATLQTPLPEVYAAAADATYFTYAKVLQSEPNGGIAESAKDLPSPLDMVQFRNLVHAYVEQAHLEERDGKALVEAVNFFASLNLIEGDSVDELEKELLDFKQSLDMTPTATPITYHTFMTISEVMLRGPVDRLEGKKDNLQKNNDGSLCATVGFFCPSADGQSGIANAAQIAASAAAASAFKEAGVIDGTATVAVVAALIKEALGLVWEGLFCTMECDECAEAAGIIVDYNGCDLNEILPLGTFEFAEGFVYLIDENRDGSYERNVVVRNSSGRVRASDLPSNPFKVIVDVECDGGTPRPWPVDRSRAVTVFPQLPSARPSGFITGPPKQSGYFYRPNTTLCFTLKGQNGNGLTFDGWTASGGSPSSGGTINSTFCTSFSSDGPKSVNARFRNDCTGGSEFITNSFVICSSCQ